MVLNMKGILSGLALLVSLVSILVMAAPTVQVKGGRTSVALSGEVLDALFSAGCELDRVKPAVVKPGSERLRFPVAGGALDLGALLGEVEHKGGVKLSCPDALDPNDIAAVTLENLRIEALDPNNVQDPNEVTVITALASVDNNLFDRIDFLMPGEGGIEVSGNGGKLKLKGVGLTLAPEAADFLNSQLGTELSAELVVGDAVSQVNIRKDEEEKEDKPGNSSGKGKAKGKDKEKDKEKNKGKKDDDPEDEESEEDDESEDD